MLPLLFLLATVTRAAVLPETPVRMRVGHDPSWATPAFDDSSWPELWFGEVPEADDSIWLRMPVDLRKLERRPGRPLGIFFGGLASHEIWWDGERIASGGVVGRTREEERPGPVEAHYQIPDRLASPGLHTVAVRVSAFHRGFKPSHGYWRIVVGEYDGILQKRNTQIALTALSGFALTAVFAFAMFWVARRDRSFLLLGGLCLAAGALLIVEAWRDLFGYTYDWHLLRLRATVALSWLTGLLLVALVLTRFPLPRRRLAFAGTAIAATIIPLIPRAWDPKSILVFFLCICVAFAWSAGAVVRRMHGSLLAAIGTGGALIALVVAPSLWLDRVAYFALDFVFVCLLCSHALEVRRERQERSRLELEMVRRHLQPHFLMNTLTALSEWIEQEPRTAVRMIESLSDELRMLNDMSTRVLVAAGDEVRLCRSHLENMGLRRDVAYELSSEGVDMGQMIPPAVFHTLVENAITHGDPASGSVSMRLTSERMGSRTRFVFEAPASPNAMTQDSRTGGGTRYIEARLREAWGERWSMQQSRQGDVWRTEIVVPGT